MFGHTHPGRGLSAAVLALLACGEAKPEAPVVPLAPASDSVVAGIGEIGEGAWLGGNRWAVLAPAHDAVAIADLSSHQVRPLGGRGAAEIRNPSTIFRAGDTLYVGDWSLRRTTLWSLDGHAVRAIPAPDALRGALPRARDAAGR